MRKQHVVILPFGMHGHLIPALMLAHRLDAIGVEVTYVCPKQRLQHVENQMVARGCSNGRIKFMALKGHSGPEVSTGKERSQHDNYTASWVTEWNLDLRNEFQELLKKMMSSSSSPPCCIIADNLVSWAQDVANELKLPRLVFYPSPAQALAVIFHIKHLVKRGRYPIATSGENIWVPGLGPLHPKDLSSPTWDTSPKEFQDFYVGNALRIHEAAGIICNTFEALEPDACTALAINRELNPTLVPFLPAGPLLPYNYLSDDPLAVIPSTEREEDLLLWLNEQSLRSVLFISFGSFGKVSAREIQELTAGIEASGHRFLWVVPSGGRYEFPKEFLARAQGRGFMFHGWVNQLMVLAHPATGGFLTHSGWNSTLESIFQGVPMIMLPLVAEQRGNARVVEARLKVGVWLSESGIFNSENVEEAVCKVMQAEGPIKENAAELRNTARQASRSADEKMVAFIEKCIESSKALE